MADLADRGAAQWRIDAGTFLRGRSFLLLLGLVAAVLGAMVLSLMAGAVTVPVPTIINTLFGLPGEHADYIILKSRLPRTLIAVLTGGALAVSGAIVQAVIRNPLASPNIIGINSGAALAAVGLVLLFPGVPDGFMPLAACLGGMTAGLAVFLVAHFRRLSAIHLALVGIAVGFVFEAGVDYLLVISSGYETSAPMIWLTGSLWGRTWAHVGMSLWPLVGLMALALVLTYRMDIIHLGEETATGLGANVPVERLLLLAVATLLASVSVAVVGVLGFVGLMAPHVARRLVGGSHRLLVPVAGLVGMLLVVLADALGRAIAPPIEVSAGILTAILGAPFFVWIMLRSGRELE